MTVSFFGHRTAPQELAVSLRKILTNLIETRGAVRFFVGNNGDFDRIVQVVLKELSSVYPHVSYTILLSYMPKPCNKDYIERDFPTALPDGIEKVPPRFAISYRNQWMVKHSDIIITYVTHSYGGAAKYKALAEKEGKEILEISLQ